MKDVNNIISQLNQMDSTELEFLSKRIFELLQASDSADRFPNTENTTEMVCRKCGSHKVSKYGKDKRGNQRYKCKSCGVFFNATSYSIVSKTHKSYDTWKKFIELTLKCCSLSYCAEVCNISVQTAFEWRHKILNVLQHDQDNRVLSGIVETDDMYLSISYKGNHKHSKKFTMPRPAFKRGSDNKGHIGLRACITCACERNGQSYGEVLGKGQPTLAMFSHAFDNRILSESIVLTDKASCVKTYFDNKNIEIVQLLAHAPSNVKEGPPEIKGVYHIQNVNNMHSRFHRFLKNYCGVSTKYLNHYLSLFIWLENHKKIDNINFEYEIIKNITSAGTYIKASEVLSLPPIPMIA